MVRAIYPGTFDPITNGHLDIIGRASVLFDGVLVAVAVDTPKHTLFTPEERTAMVQEACRLHSGVEVKPFSGLLVHFAQREGTNVMVKGLRAVSDFEAELQMALMNRALWSELETVFLMTRPEHLYLSSSVIRELAHLGGDVDAFVPAGVAAALRRRHAAG
jgi:pantetheine-phosphate adenylyltransferase